MPGRVRRTMTVIVAVRRHDSKGGCFSFGSVFRLGQVRQGGAGRQVSPDALDVHPVSEEDTEEQYGKGQYTRQPGRHTAPRYTPG
jgi:hypothetical protein